MVRCWSGEGRGYFIATGWWWRPARREGSGRTPGYFSLRIIPPATDGISLKHSLWLCNLGGANLHCPRAPHRVHGNHVPARRASRNWNKNQELSTIPGDRNAINAQVWGIKDTRQLGRRAPPFIDHFRIRPERSHGRSWCRSVESCFEHYEEHQPILRLCRCRTPHKLPQIEREERHSRQGRLSGVGGIGGVAELGRPLTRDNGRRRYQLLSRLEIFNF